MDSNADDVAKQIGETYQRIRVAVKRATNRAGLMVQVRTQANASLPAKGPPGPRAITGDYRGSWSTDPGTWDGGETVETTVGTNKPQAQRLERGFTGADALGRHYRQRPYPHLRPAVDATTPEYLAAMKEALDS